MPLELHNVQKKKKTQRGAFWVDEIKEKLPCIFETEGESPV